MGFCGTVSEGAVIDPAAARASRMVMRRLADEASNASGKKKLLLLGAGESGKSTVFKQMRMLHSAGYAPAELKQFKRIIHRNAIDGIKILIEAAQKMDLDMTDANEDVADRVLLYDGENLNPELAGDIDALWADGAIQQAFGRRHEFQLGDSASYFLDAVRRIGAAEYLPTTDDVLRARVRTSGVVSKDFEIQGVPFQMYDVGGQRSERRKWLPLFDHVTAIVFVAALSEYNQVMAEDGSMNRMKEALELFTQIVNSHHFAGIDVMLFLNKKDLFAEKIKTVDPGQWFPEYTGGCDYAKAEAFFKQQFVARVTDKKKEIFTYTTCATDTGNIKAVFDTVTAMFVGDMTGDTFAM